MHLSSREANHDRSTLYTRRPMLIKAPCWHSLCCWMHNAQLLKPALLYCRFHFWLLVGPHSLQTTGFSACIWGRVFFIIFCFLRGRVLRCQYNPSKASKASSWLQLSEANQFFLPWGFCLCHQLKRTASLLHLFVRRGPSPCAVKIAWTFSLNLF